MNLYSYEITDFLRVHFATYTTKAAKSVIQIKSDVKDFKYTREV